MYKIREQQLNNFDFVRLFLAVLVIYSHCYILTSGSDAREPFSRMSHGYVTGGDLAVDMFFLVSGFLVTASLIRSTSVWAYFKKRIARIYPGFLGATLFTLLVIGPLSSGRLGGSTPLSQLLHALLKTVTLRDFDWVGAFSQNPFPETVNGSLWTIHYEFACYIFLAVLGICGILHSRRACLIVFALSWVAEIGVSVYVWNFNTALAHGMLVNSARFVPLFLSGAAGYLYRERLAFRYSWALGSLLALAAVSQIPNGITCMFPLAGTYLVLFVAYNPAIRLHNFARFGDFSYGTYLYACPIQQLIVQRFVGHLGPFGLFFIATPLTLIVGAVSWHAIEKRFLLRSRLARADKPSVVALKPVARAAAGASSDALVQLAGDASK